MNTGGDKQQKETGSGAPGSEVSAPVSFSHGLLAITFPGLFLAGAWSILADITGAIRFTDPIFALAVLAGGLASVALQALFAQIRGGEFARQRALALSVFAVYGMRAALAGGGMAERLIPTLRFAVCVLAYVAEWVWAGSVFRFLSDREKVIADMEKRGAETIFHAFREENYLLKDAVSGISRAAGLTGFLAVALLAACLFPLLWGTAPSARTIILVGAFFVVREFVLALFRHYREEFALASLGLPNAFSYTGGRVAPAIAVIALAATVAALAAISVPVVPSAWFFALLARLFAFLNRPGTARAAPETFDYDNDSNYEPALPPTLPDAGEPLFDPRFLFMVIKYAALAAAALGAFWFLFGPFFKRRFREFFTEGTALRYLRSLLATIRSGFAAFSRAVAGAFRTGPGFRLKKGRTGDRAASRDFRETARLRAASAQSPEKKAEIGRLTAIFAKLIEFGSGKDIRWERHEAPLEYARRLGTELDTTQVETVSEDLSLAGRLYEKALYAKELLTKAEEAAFSLAVERVLSAEAGTPDRSEENRR